MDGGKRVAPSAEGEKEGGKEGKVWMSKREST